jgi:hypothetical protein
MNHWPDIKQSIKRVTAIGIYLYFRICLYEGPENQKGLKSTATHDLLVYAADVNLLEDNKSTTRNNTKLLIDTNNEAALAVNAEKTKYMLLSHHKNAGKIITQTIYIIACLKK